MGFIKPVLSLSDKLQSSLYAHLKKRNTGKRQTKAKRVACGRFVERPREVDYIVREKEREWMCASFWHSFLCVLEN